MRAWFLFFVVSFYFINLFVGLLAVVGAELSGVGGDVLFVEWMEGILLYKICYLFLFCFCLVCFVIYTSLEEHEYTIIAI